MPVYGTFKNAFKLREVFQVAHLNILIEGDVGARQPGGVREREREGMGMVWKGAAAIVLLLLCLCPGIFPFWRVQTAELFFLLQLPPQGRSRAGVGGGDQQQGRSRSRLSALLSSTICECIFYAANNLIKILCVCLGHIKVIIEGRFHLLTPSSTPLTTLRCHASDC